MARTANLADKLGKLETKLEKLRNDKAKIESQITECEAAIKEIQKKVDEQKYQDFYQAIKENDWSVEDLEKAIAELKK